MFETTSNPTQPRNFLQFHEHAFVSPLNLINVTNPAPVTFGRAPHILQQISPRQTIDPKKLHMYQFLAERKLKEDRWKKEMNDKIIIQPAASKPNRRSTSSQGQNKAIGPRSISVPKKKNQPRPSPIHFSRPVEPSANLSENRRQELREIHESIVVQLRRLHHPPARENVIDETEQEKQRRLRLKREQVKHDSRAIYHAHQELKQILQDIRQPDFNLARIIHRLLSAYKSIFLALKTLTNEAPIKPQDESVQQLLSSVLSILNTLLHVNHALGFNEFQIDPIYLRAPSNRSARSRREVSPPPNQLLPSIYQELMKKKQKKSRTIPSVLYQRPKSAETVRLPRSITRSTISTEQKTRTRSHSPIGSSIETPFYSTLTVDEILMKLAPHLLRHFTGQALNAQIDRARTIIPMFLTDNRMTQTEVIQRVLQMLMPLDQSRTTDLSLPLIGETSEERSRRVDIDIYQTQISHWDEEMAQIRQRLQNYRTNRLETETNERRVNDFHFETTRTFSPLPEHVQIHQPLYEDELEGFPLKINSESIVPFHTETLLASDRDRIRLKILDSNKIRQIERYRKEYRAYLQRTESAPQDDFDPSKLINR